MDTLVLITSHFPYGNKEAFIEAEYPLLANAFKRVIIISRNVTDKEVRNVMPNTICIRHDPVTRGLKWFRLFGLIVINIPLIASLISNELFFRKSINKPLNLSQKAFLIKKTFKAVQLKDFIVRTTKKLNIDNTKILYYSYWFTTGANSICMLKDPECIKISRAHRVDLYEEESEYNYIPLIKFNYDNLDKIFFISDHGRSYFQKLTNLDANKLVISRLGVYSAGVSPEKNDSIIRIASCSSLTSVKRVDIIIKALALIKIERDIIWHHFGDGPLKDYLANLAEDLLGNHKYVNYVFHGHISNNELLTFYSSNYIDIFLNVSSSEGLPVSIMEAQSFGIPIIATASGGTDEIVSNDLGVVHPVDLRIEDLTSSLETFFGRSKSDICNIRNSNRDNWNKNFNSDKNYSNFIATIKSLMTVRNHV